MIRFPISRFIVSDRSMEPSYREGDHVLTVNFGKVGVGDVAVFEDEGKYLIKRVREIESKRVIADADNKTLAKKIWKFDKGKVIGKVILKY